MSTSSSWPSSSRTPAVTPQRVEVVLREAAHGLGQAVACMHGVAARSRAYSVAQAMREDADQLALVQRAVNEVLRDLYGGREPEPAERLPEAETGG